VIAHIHEDVSGAAGPGEPGHRGSGRLARRGGQRGVSWVDRVAVSCAFSAKKIAAP
jgi:hypothetical protein